MKRLTTSFVLLAAACGAEKDQRTLFLSSDTKNCERVEQVCLESYPPQCFDYCADEKPAPPPDCGVVEPPVPLGGPAETGGGTGPSVGVATSPDILYCGVDPCIAAPVMPVPGGTVPAGAEADKDEPPPIIVICPPPTDPCVVSYDAATGKEFIECPDQPIDDCTVTVTENGDTSVVCNSCVEPGPDGKVPAIGCPTDPIPVPPPSEPIEPNPGTR